jgi:hypothetical protein
MTEKSKTKQKQCSAGGMAQLPEYSPSMKTLGSTLVLQ